MCGFYCDKVGKKLHDKKNNNQMKSKKNKKYVVYKTQHKICLINTIKKLPSQNLTILHIFIRILFKC